jgi:ABC-type Fe3+-hydroxamate transport system substrate-binding protein
MRVVSLVPSVTETLSMWGVEPIACTRFCERLDLAHVGGTKNPDIDAIVRLEPDLIVMDAEENRKEDAEALTSAGLDVLALDVVSIESLNRDLARLATAVGVGAPDQIERPAGEPLLRVAVPIWRRPWMTIGANTYGSDLLAAIGVANVCADSATSYPEVTLDDLAARKPDAVLVPSEPYVFTDEHLAELATVARPVRVDGQDLFWWGTRTPRAIARLRDVIADLVTR